MEVLDLAHLFESLVMPLPAVHGGDLAAVPIPGAATHRLAKDVSGSPCLLLRQPAQIAREAPIRLDNLSVSFGVNCSVTMPGCGVEHDTFTIVRCSATDRRLFPHFLKIIAPVVAALGPSPTTADVRRMILGMVALFQALVVPAKKTIQGLWAELLLIRLSSDPQSASRAWHRNPYEKFDFVDGSQRIEVKSNGARQREHYFSLAQLEPLQDTRIAVASVFVERAGGGVSLGKVVSDTRALLSGDVSLITRFDAVVYQSLGSGWADAMDECFDWELAVDSIAFFAADSVPRPENPTPQSVFDVRFRSSLSSAPQLSSQDMREAGGLFAVAWPAGRLTRST